MSTNFWQTDFDTLVVQSPVAILREQSAFLGQKTNGQVVGEVIQDEEFDESGCFLWMMYLRAPALGNYRFRLLSVEHGVEFYPLTVRVDPEAIHAVLKQCPEISHASMGMVKNSEQLKKTWFVSPDKLEIGEPEEFLKILKIIFNSDRIIKVVNAIRAQITA
jgi:hypothetical protein